MMKSEQTCSFSAPFCSVNCTPSASCWTERTGFIGFHCAPTGPATNSHRRDTGAINPKNCLIRLRFDDSRNILVMTVLRVSFLGSSGGKQSQGHKRAVDSRDLDHPGQSLLIPGGDCLSGHVQNQAGRPNLVPLMTRGIVRV